MAYILINDIPCTSLERLKALAATVEQGDETYNYLLDLQYEGEIADFLDTQGDEGKLLAEQLRTIPDRLGDIALMERVLTVIGGHVVSFERPNLLHYVELQGMWCEANGKRIECKNNHLQEELPAGEVKFVYSFRVKKEINEDFELALNSNTMGVSRTLQTVNLSLMGYSKKDTVQIDFMAKFTSPQQTTTFALNYGDTVIHTLDANPNKEVFTVNGVEFKMIRVDGGTFNMGSNDGDDDEMPVHKVSLSSYYIGETQVTQELWQAVMGNNPSRFKGAKYPVENVSWDDCKAFIDKLNEITRKQFRLPTEAEWEFAARGGNKSNGFKYSGSDNLDEVAWYNGNSNNGTHPVAKKKRNELGLYDMSGNVWEWCYDAWDENFYKKSPQNNPVNDSGGSDRVDRGGGWDNRAGYCRVSCRGYDDRVSWDTYLGLRLAL